MSEQQESNEEWASFSYKFARHLQQLRVERGYSQDQVAYAAGLSRSSYQRLERGRSQSGTDLNPTLRNLLAVAQVLNVTLDELVPHEWPEVRVGNPVRMKRRRSNPSSDTPAEQAAEE